MQGEAFKRGERTFLFGTGHCEHPHKNHTKTTVKISAASPQQSAGSILKYVLLLMRGQICDLLIFIFNSSTHHRRKRCTNVTSIDPESHMVQSQLNSQFYRNTALSTISPRKKTEAAKTICFQMFLHNTNSRACPAALDYSSLV